MGKLYDSMIENGVNKGNLVHGSSMCIMGHLGHVLLDEGLWVIENEEHVEVYNPYTEQYEIEWITNTVQVDFKKYLDATGTGEQELWDQLGYTIQQVVMDVISEEFPATEVEAEDGDFSWYKWDFTNPWAFNDDDNITEDDILRVGKLIDERLDELGLA